MQTILERFNNTFIVSAFVPSLGFVLTAMVIFAPVIPPRVIARIPITFDPPSTGLLFLFVFTLVLGFTLNNLNDYFLQLTEGYYLLDRFSFLRKRQQRKAMRWQYQIKQIKQLLAQIENLPDVSSEESLAANDATDRVQKRRQAIIKQLEDKLYYLQSLYSQTYPPDHYAILPTRFGNILRAAETYPVIRYGIDSVPMWSRMTYVVPPQYDQRIIQSYQGLSFLIVSMVLSLLLSCLCLLATVYQMMSWRFALSGIEEILYFIPVVTSERMQMIYLQRSGLYLVGSLVALGVAAFFYYASIPMAVEFGNMIRSTYDLFRFDLLDALKLEKQTTRSDEVVWWTYISRFMVANDFKEIPFELDYQFGEKAREAGSARDET